MSSQCHGCYKSFIGSNLLRHLRNTRHPACLDYLDSLLRRSFERPLLHEEDGTLVDIPENLFGDYDTSDDKDWDTGSNDEDVDMGPHFESPAGTFSDDFDSDSHDEGQHHFEDEEDNWEPPCGFEDFSHSPSPRSPSPQLIFPEGFFAEPLQLPKPRVPSVSQSSAVRQPYVQQYPDPRAGAPIEGQGTILEQMPGHRFAPKRNGKSHVGQNCVVLARLP
ncbi:hypothetical protein F5890DRAFT_1560172 [Lentinula detonsa]|uniref:Uncharacterized protein n=1 Tax=Lentinula detonsa TaxID=2804962 RepID=A0AA38PNK7_9AGAR|nr:hypothetical protein F5890DRAFT_1560172 [Lentinula detonsa]